MEALHVFRLASAADPFAGVVAWGGIGLLAWFLFAASVGMMLGLLRRGASPKPIRIATTLPSDEDQRDAA